MLASQKNWALQTRTSWICKHKMIFKSKLCQVFLAVEFWCAISPVTHTTIIQLVQVNLDFVQGQVGLLLKATHTRKIIIYRNVNPPRLKTSLCWEWKDISGGILCQVCGDQYQKRLITIQSARDPMQFRGFSLLEETFCLLLHSCQWFQIDARQVIKWYNSLPGSIHMTSWALFTLQAC